MARISLKNLLIRKFQEAKALGSSMLPINSMVEVETHVLKNNKVSKNEAQLLKNFQQSIGTQLEQQDLHVINKLLDLAPKASSGSYTRFVNNFLNKARQDLKLDSSELQNLSTELSNRFSPDIAQLVIRNIIKENHREFTLDSVQWAQIFNGNFNGHTDRIRSILQSHIQNAQLLDANSNGKADLGDIVWKQGQAGNVEIGTVDESLANRLRIGEAMVNACSQMSAVRHQFEVLKDHRANPAFFDLQNSVFALKVGVKASDAMLDIFENPHLYGFECATALVIVYYRAVLDILGTEDFDRLFSDLKIGPWVYENDLDRFLVSGYSSGNVADTTMPTKFKAGDYGYIKNWDVSPKGKEEGWQGENVIYLGDGKFYGHPFGISSEQDIVDHLNSNRNPGSTRSASWVSTTQELSSDLLSEDLVATV